MRKIWLCGAALVLAACSQPAQQDAVAIDPAIEAIVRAVAPDVIITGGELDADDGEYEVSARTPEGEEIEFDLLQTDGVWRVVQIQRDVTWDSAPEAVRIAYEAAPGAFEPVRVIESTDPVDGAVYYQLFSAADRPGFPSVQVRWYEGKAAVTPPPH